MRKKVNIQDFKKRIIKFRKSLGYSRSKLGDMLDITGRNVRYYETETNKFPPVELLLKMTEIFNVSLEELLGFDETYIDSRTVEAKILNKLKGIAKLPQKERDTLIQMLDTFLKKSGIS